MDIHLEPFLMGEKSIQLAHSWGFQRSPWFSLQDAEAGIKCSLNILLMFLRIKDTDSWGSVLQAPILP